MGYWLRMPGECEERISDSVAPEHLRGTCRMVRCIATRRNVSVRPCQRCSCFFPGQHSSLAGRSPAIAP